MKNKLQLLAAAALVSLLTLPATAQITAVSDPLTLNVTDTIQWTATPGSPGANFDILSTGGLNTNVSHTGSGAFEVRTQGSSWFGCFLPGETLLWNGGENGVLTIDPDGLIGGAGLNIQANYFGSYTARISAFDSIGGLLGSVTGSGFSSSNGDGSALFLGFASTSVNVDKFSIELTAASNGVPGDFAINGVMLADSMVSAVPEPSTYGLIGAALAVGLVAFRRFRRKA